nr:DUF721 domain-containing protein [Nocardiopsis kunsanensis]
MDEFPPHPVDGPGGPGVGAGQSRPHPVDASSSAAERGQATGADLARQALARARAQARERGGDTRAPHRARRRGRLRSRAEPQMFGDAVRTWLIEHGWQEQVAIGGVFGRWADIVGEFNASRLKPESFSEGELVVVADSPTMAAQARTMVRPLMRKLNEELGDGTVLAIKVRGPGSRRR